MKQVFVLSLILALMMGALNAQDTIKIRTGDSQIAEQNYNEGVKHLQGGDVQNAISKSVSYTHLRAHETPEHLVCRLLLEKKKQNKKDKEKLKELRKDELKVR